MARAASLPGLSHKKLFDKKGGYKMAQEYYDPWSNTKTKNGLEADLVISAL